jgi:hypothetical protein
MAACFACALALSLWAFWSSMRKGVAALEAMGG